MKISLISLPKNIAEGAIRKTVFKSPPVTHLWLASILMKDGHEVDIVDALTEGKDIAAVIEHLKAEKPDLIGFTVFTSAFHDVLYAAKAVKEALPSALTAVGGYHVNSIPEDFQKDYIDLVFIGETEFSVLELANRFDAGNFSREDIPGLMYFDAATQTWKNNVPAPFRQEFDDQPLLPYHKILHNNYNTWWTTIDHRKHKYMATVTGRGCPMGCSFCDITKTEGAKYRAMSTERVLLELEHMQSLGITHVEFRDPFFTANTRRVNEIAQGMIDRGIKIEWGCSSTIRKIQGREQLRLLYNAGCRFLFFGVESGNPDILYREKKVSPEKVIEVVKMTRQEKIQAHCSFIFGLEGETPETLQQTLDLSIRLNPSSASYSIAIPYPGTAQYNSYKAKGYITTYDWRYYGTEEPVFETPELSKEILKEMLDRAHRKFYFRPRYVWQRFLALTSFQEFMNHASIASRMLVDVTAYKR